MQRTFVAAITAGALAIGGVPIGAFAQEPPVVVDPVALGEQLFGALVQTREGGNDRVAHLLVSAELIEWRKQNPSAPAATVVAHFTARRQALAGALTAHDHALPEPDFAIRALNALRQAPPSSVARSEHVLSLIHI